MQAYPEFNEKTVLSIHETDAKTYRILFDGKVHPQYVGLRSKEECLTRTPGFPVYHPLYWGDISHVHMYAFCSWYEVAALDTVQYDDALLVTRLSVPAAYRRQGIATHLMKTLIAAADERSISLYLEVYASGDMSRSDLIDWYESLGFVMIEDNFWCRKHP